MTGGAPVTVEGLAYAYPDGHRALDGLDLRVDSGQRVALLGPNGAGKTTLALHLNGVLRAGGGRIRIGDLTLDDGTVAEIRRRVGLVFQDADDQLFMPTVRDDVAFGPANLGLRGRELDDRVAEALAAVGARRVGQRAPHHLSGGEKRRVALATVLAMRPDVLVLDEPTASLDPLGRRQLVEILQGLAMTQLVITHDLPFALELCEHAVIVNRGRVVAGGDTAGVLGDERLLRANSLELPYGFHPAGHGPRGARQAASPRGHG